MDDFEVMNSFGEDDGLAMMPEGFAEGDDIFSPDSWSGRTESETGDGAETEALPGTDAGEYHATGNEAATGSSRDVDSEPTAGSPATEAKNESEALTKRKVKYQFNHTDVEEELDLEKDLPELLQKARSTERYKERLDRANSVQKRVSAVAKSLGYDDADAFLTAIRDGAIENEKKGLLAKGVPAEIADDYASRKFALPDVAADADEDIEGTDGNLQQEVSQSEAPVSESAPEPSDYKEGLFSYRPDLRTKGIPAEVTDAIDRGVDPVRALLEYENRQGKAEIERLRNENRIHRQNADSASRAPVLGVSKGGDPSDSAESDPFLKGFNSEDW